MFSGAYWTGAKSLEMGLIDGIGHLSDELRRKFGKKVKIIEISAPKGWGSRLGLGAVTEMPEAFLNTVETRALWQRFGL